MDGAARSWVQRTLIALTAVLALGGGLSAGAVAYGVYRVENIPTEPVREVLSPRAPDVVRPAGPTRLLPDPTAGAEEVVDEVVEEEETVGAPFNILLVGDSSRDFVETQEDLDSFGNAEEGRGSDSILLVRVDPAAGTAKTLPFPRDLWVELADGSGRQRINKAYENGGARLLIETIQQRFGVPVNHYVRLDFAGFRSLVDAVGGVTLAVEHPARDFNRRTGRNESGLDIRRAGCVTLAGDQALAYVRSRHFQQLIDGRWVPDNRSDFGRSERQQQFLRQVLAKALSEGLLRPRLALDLLDAADESVRLSDDLGAEEIADLVRDVRRLSPDAFTNYALPVTDHVTAAGAQVLELVDDEAEPILERFRDDPSPVPGRGAGAARRWDTGDHAATPDRLAQRPHVDGAPGAGVLRAGVLRAALS